MDHKFYAELFNMGGSLGVLSANSLEELRREVAKEWLPLLEAGDNIKFTSAEDYD